MQTLDLQALKTYEERHYAHLDPSDPKRKAWEAMPFLSQCTIASSWVNDAVFRHDYTRARLDNDLYGDNT